MNDRQPAPSPETRALWLAIGGLPHMGLTAIGELARRWPDPFEALARIRSAGDDLKGIVPLSKRWEVSSGAQRIDDARTAACILAELDRCGGRLVATAEPPLSELLAAEEGWPPVVSARGGLPAPPTVAIVGMRKASLPGRRFASRLAADLAAEGVCVVSGLAFGIDRASHEGAVAAGRTVAVLAGGVARPSPLAHIALAGEVLRSEGGLVSHVPPLSDAPGWRFPIRNRLIAGLAQAVVVVEAAARGGSLSTAAHAVRLGRPLLAVPGPPWWEHSSGTNSLLADGALVCRDALDVLAAIGRAPTGRPVSRDRPHSLPAVEALDDDELAVLDAVPATPEPIDSVARESQLPLVTVLSALGRLEQLGLVEAPTPSTVMRTDCP